MVVMGTVSDLNSANGEKEVRQSETLTVVDLWHERCPWCLGLNPVVEQVAREYKARAKQLVDKGEDIGLGRIHICDSCGYTLEG